MLSRTPLGTHRSPGASPLAALAPTPHWIPARTPVAWGEVRRSERWMPCGESGALQESETFPGADRGTQETQLGSWNSRKV